MLNVYAVDIMIWWVFFICDNMAKKVIFEDVNFSIEDGL